MTENTKPKRPSHTIYKVIGDGEEVRWVKVGVGFQHKDGHGVALVFDGIPVEGRIVLREVKTKVVAALEPDQPEMALQIA